MGNGTAAAIFHSVFQYDEIPAAVMIEIQRAKTEQTVDLFEFMAWIVFAILIGEPPVIVSFHIRSHA